MLHSFTVIKDEGMTESCLGPVAAEDFKVEDNLEEEGSSTPLATEASYTLSETSSYYSREKKFMLIRQILTELVDSEIRSVLDENVLLKLENMKLQKKVENIRKVLNEDQRDFYGNSFWSNKTTFGMLIATIVFGWFVFGSNNDDEFSL